jgi:hypothetical protein
MMIMIDDDDDAAAADDDDDDDHNDGCGLLVPVRSSSFSPPTAPPGVGLGDE